MHNNSAESEQRKHRSGIAYFEHLRLLNVEMRNDTVFNNHGIANRPIPKTGAAPIYEKPQFAA